MPDLWPFVPAPSIHERIEWATDVVRAQSAEMRTSLHAGEQYIRHTYPRSSAYQNMDAVFSGAPYGDWYVPLWHQSSKAGAVASADTSLSVDLDADYTDKAVIFAACDDYLIVDIDAITTTLDLTGAVGQDFTNPTVAPVRLCAPTNGASTARMTRRHTSFDIEFRSRELFAPSGSSYATLGGLPYLACSAAVIKPLAGSIVHPTELVDSGFGVFDLVEMRDDIDRALQISLTQTTASARQEFRKFLGDVRGRDGAFWVSDWEGALALTASLSNGALTASFTGVLDDVTGYVGRAVRIGDELRTVTSSADLGGGVHQIGFDALTADATTARLLRKVRLASDRIEMQHQRGFTATTTFNVIEVSA